LGHVEEGLGVQFKYKLTAALVMFVLLIGIVYGIQSFFLSRTPNDSTPTSYRLDETFTAQSFIYGPQAWVPYASKMPVVQNGEVDGGEGFYVMFVDLNATSNLTSTFPCVRVDYAFVGLQGTAAFHVYGYIQANSGISWTNRVDGDGTNGYYVTTDTGASTNLAGAQVMESYNHIYVKVANSAGVAFDDFGNNTYFMKFEKAGGGLNSLHITTHRTVPTGMVTQTGNVTGTFYVNFTGDRVQDNFVLLVAVNGTIGDDFELRLQSSIPE
jgi:uncharacterized protein YdbL (DUF1318 family)